MMKAPSSPRPARDPSTLPETQPHLAKCPHPETLTEEPAQDSERSNQLHSAPSTAVRASWQQRPCAGTLGAGRGNTDMDTSWVPSFLPGPVSKQNTLQGNDGEKCESTCEHAYCTSLPETEAPVYWPPPPPGTSVQFSRPVMSDSLLFLLLQSEVECLKNPPGAWLPRRVFLGRLGPALPLGLCGVTASQGRSQKRVIEIHSPGHQVIRVTCFLALQSGFPWVRWPFWAFCPDINLV